MKNGNKQKWKETKIKRNKKGNNNQKWKQPKWNQTKIATKIEIRSPKKGRGESKQKREIKVQTEYQWGNKRLKQKIQGKKSKQTRNQKNMKKV